jgi:hypothetical protein
MTLVRSTAPTAAFQAPSPAIAGAASGGGPAVVGALAVATGITGRPVPVEQAAPRRVGRVALAQLAQPFRLRAATGGPS